MMILGQNQLCIMFTSNLNLQIKNVTLNFFYLSFLLRTCNNISMEVYLPRSWLQSVVIAYTKIELFKEIKIFYLPGWRSAAQKIGLSSCVRFARKT